MPILITWMTDILSIRRCRYIILFKFTFTGIIRHLNEVWRVVTNGAWCHWPAPIVCLSYWKLVFGIRGFRWRVRVEHCSVARTS